MVRMTYRIRDDERDLEFTFDGQEDEVLRLYRKIAGLETNQIQPASEPVRTEPKHRIDMPTDQDVEVFIKSRPNFEHDLHIIQNEFFGKIFSSRGSSASMYHRTNRQVKLVREKIEKDMGAKFKEQIIDRNFKRYRMETQATTPLVQLKFNDEK